MSNTSKRFFLTILLGLLTIVGLSYFVMGDRLFDKDYTKKDLIENYKEKTKEIYELNAFYASIIPPDCIVEIEFHGNKLLNFSVSMTEFSETIRDADVESFKVLELLGKLGWTNQTLKALKEKLDAACCISIKNGEPSTIGFQRRGMGKYYYNLFGGPIPKAKRNTYGDSCYYILYNDSVVLEYGGGAIGPQCFER